MLHCPCIECVRSRQAADGIRKIKAELPKPEYDWDDLEQQSKRSRDDPEWYKKRAGR
jgi:hypothetical protein